MPKKAKVAAAAPPVDRSAIEKAIAAVQKVHGKDSCYRLGDRDVQPVEVISTGSVGLDKALGVGGYPRGRIIEIFGPESAGKTTLALHAVAEAQRKGGVCAFVDAEHALDVQYAQNLGVNTDDLILSQPDCGEQALEIVEAMVGSGSVWIVVVDSVAALTPRAELEGEMGDSHMGLQARLMSQAMRKLTARVSQTGTLVVFLNQLRQKIGVQWGNPETTTGGNALKFYASVRVDVRRIGAVKAGASGDDEKGQAVGSKTRAKVVKNKCAPPFREAEFNIMYGRGISRASEIFDLAVACQVIEQSGAWFSHQGERIGQGRLNVLTMLDEQTDLLDKITEEVRSSQVSAPPPPEEEVPV